MNNVLDNLIFPVLASVISGLILNYMLKRKEHKDGEKGGPAGSETDGAAQGMLRKADVRIAAVMLTVFCVASAVSFLSTRPPDPGPTGDDPTRFPPAPTEGSSQAPSGEETDSVIYYENGDRYVGETENGQPNGKGTCNYTDGSEYVGDWKSGLKDGAGILSYAEGGRYEGEFRADRPDGDGVYYWKNGDKLEAKWADGALNGKGTMTCRDGSVLTGIWRNDELVVKMIDNLHTWNSADGTGFTGNEVNGLIEGYGRSVGGNDTYLGDFKNGKRDGNGICYYGNGDRYDGEWKNGYMEGKGVFYYKEYDNWYQGEFSNGKRNGTGTFYFSSGARYEGEWKDNDYQGTGIMWYAPDDGAKRWYFTGVWEGDMKRGTLYYKDGRCESGVWKDGEMLETSDGPVGIFADENVRTWEDADGSSLTGTQKDGLLSGNGILVYKNNSMYIGEFQNGGPTGSGTRFYNDGGIYVGSVQNGQREGSGAFPAFSDVPQ